VPFFIKSHFCGVTSNRRFSLCVSVSVGRQFTLQFSTADTRRSRGIFFFDKTGFEESNLCFSVVYFSAVRKNKNYVSYVV
jgi:hypothetical protein